MYSVQYEADHVERRSRLTTFFRYFTAIPAALLTMLYVLAAHFAVIGAWFAIVFTGRYPEGIYDFVAGALRNSTRLNAYASLVTDRYPPWHGAPDDDYPVRVHIGPPKESYSRLKTGFRFILAIPVMIISYVFALLAEVGAFCAWFVIVVTGKMPVGLQDIIDMGIRYLTRANAYYWLITEDWPPLTDPQAPSSIGPGPSALPMEPAAPAGTTQPPTV